MKQKNIVIFAYGCSVEDIEARYYDTEKEAREAFKSNLYAVQLEINGKTEAKKRSQF